MFANLFEKVPAKRAGIPEDIIGTILYLCSKAGVFLQRKLIFLRLTLMDGVCVLMEGEFLLRMDRNESQRLKGIIRIFSSD